MTLLAKWLKRASTIFSEKPDVKVDDFGLEHFLVYHGLVGTSPDNHREFKDVRADITSAVNRSNSHNLCINLKLAPLWWEDKLVRIFTELKEANSERMLAALLPPKSDDYEVHDYDPLRHQDWRVRANAALILADLQIAQAQAGIIRALAATADNTTPAFCHISRALAAFRTEEAKQALVKYLSNDEPWIKVDAVSALARWPIAEVGNEISSAFSQYHPFTDYAAVGVARQHKPLELLALDDEKLIDLGAALIVGLIEASKQTFSGAPEILTEAGVQQCLPLLMSALKAKPNSLRMRALYQLADWLDDNCPEQSTSAAKALIENKELREKVVAEIESLILALGLASNSSSKNSKPASKTDTAIASSSALRHGLKLTGEIDLQENAQLLSSMVENEQALPYRNEMIEAMGRLGNGQTAPQLVKLARQLVNVESRTQMPLSASPILEADLEAANSYWYILKALANLPHSEALEFLLLATGDYASDKREEALASAVKLCAASGFSADKTAIKAAVAKALNDPSTQVRLQALQGVAKLNLDDQISAVTRMINAQEISVSKASFDTLLSLVSFGHKSAVATALSDIKKTTSSTVKIKRIDEFLSQNC
ncbi:HEAT repeat domain-containing protein [bacterium]|nr:HEAT repeat domain-containing protein [bacterium]MBP9810384.1 HEAT repeat domain-containing protein [bacterium]